MSPAWLVEPQVVRTAWGGTRVAPRFGWDIDGQVGEYWLMSCHAKAITSLLAADGSTGPALTDWLDGRADSPELPTGLPSAAGFPLLAKFLDSDERLSVQVHPDDVIAPTQGEPNGKTEAWHILAAEPDAEMWVGLAADVTVEQLVDTVAGGAASAEVEALLRRVPARAGDTWLIEAGTVHAVGPGVTLYEIQQTSDATWRIYDWDRPPTPERPLHLAEAKAAASAGAPIEPVPEPADESGWTTLVACAAFALDRGRVDGELSVGDAPWCAITVLNGSGTLRFQGGSLGLTPGATALVHGEATLIGKDLRVLRALPPAR